MTGNGGPGRHDGRCPKTTPPAGCQTPIPLVRKLLADTDVAERFEELIRGEPGNPTGTNQYTSGNRDNITVSTPGPDTIPIRPRDYTSEAPTGTSTSYALRRLRNHRPDLLEKVQAGAITPNAAMLEAGFRKRKLQVDDDSESLAAYLTAG